MKLETYIRSLARSSYWQEIYHTSKECSGINLFENTSKFSGVQVLFIHWLKVYSTLYNEMYSQKWENLDKEVIEDNDRCDAFLYWRYVEQKKEASEHKKEMKKFNKGKAKPNQKSYPLFRGNKK